MSLHFVSGVPKTTLRLIDSLEVFTELRSYYIHDYSLLHERYIKINREKEHRSNPEETRHKHSGVLSQWSYVGHA